VRSIVGAGAGVTPLSCAVDLEDTDAVRGPGDHEVRVGNGPVEDVRLAAVDAPAVTVAGGGDRDITGPPGAGLLREGHGHDVAPVRDTREETPTRLLVVEREQQLRRHHTRAEEGRGQEHAAHLLEHQSEFEEAEPASAVLLWDRETLEAQLLRHPLPQARVVAGRLVELRPYGTLRDLALEE
jgi:hypothetical protein